MTFFSRPTGDWISKWFGARIVIEITDERVIFRNGAQIVSLRPGLHLDGGNIAGIGEPPHDRTTNELDVLHDTWPGVASENVLAKFFVSGISRLMNRSLMVRPVVVVSLGTASCSREQVMKALALAGIRNATIVQASGDSQ